MILNERSTDYERGREEERLREGLESILFSSTPLAVLVRERSIQPAASDPLLEISPWAPSPECQAGDGAVDTF
jgi:hypothetical protein